ncbi:ABC transporter permease [Ignisphaera sp. 4213-co]|uniref:ABC transporter permease n=1 Tax=Ignisphaera cupida TaxID=3050454 RepID=A0ABD4Z531_9CREN|nr:ABC transporter permease [Ignisphaera sp. 4213-co]MDK6028224.1 ABC transporter permease [Ignisphaera sp. 4213-co]
MNPLIYMLLRNMRFVVGLSIFMIVVLLGTIGPLIYTKDPLSFAGPMETPPSPQYPLGTDTYGRDILAQLLWGTRNSLYVGLLTAVIATIIGLVIGSVAGIKGGIIDEVLMSITNIVLSIPGMLLAILVASYLKVRAMEMVALLLGVTSWPWFARAIRAQLMSLKEREYVYLSKMAGLEDLKIAFADLLPNIASYVFMAFVLYVNGGILGEAGLSIIGVGPTRGVTLGLMLQWAALMEAVRRGLWWWFIPPGAVMVAATSSLMVISTALDEIFNPRLRQG